MSLVQYTNYDNLSVDSLKVAGATIQPAQVGSPWATHYFVDGNLGSDDYDGLSSEKPFLTMDAAFDVIGSGDVIWARGNIREQLTTPAGVFGVTIVGIGEGVTRHPDAHTSNNGYKDAFRWNAPATPTASTPLLKIQQQGWKLYNILFTGDEDDSVGCVQLYRDGASGDSERDASHAVISGCRFQAGLYGIQDSGGCARVKIYGNEFLLFSVSDNDAITNVTGAGVGTVWGWEIVGNKFHANYSDIDLACTGPSIVGNHFHRVSLGTTNTIALDMTGSTEELVSKNWMYSDSALAGSINARFTDSASTTAYWGPNYYSDKEEYAEPAE